MIKFFLFLYTIIFAFSSGVMAGLGSETREALFQERTRSLVAVEYFIQREIDRTPREAVGLCIDDKGTIVLLDSAIPGWLPHEQFRDFRVFLPDEGGEGHKAVYLGPDYLNGWHYLRGDEDLRKKLLPITALDRSTPKIGDSLWGIGLLGKDFDYQPFLLEGQLSMTQRLPLEVGFSESLLGAPGGPVFDSEGRFLGWIGNPVTRERMLMTGTERYKVGLRAIRESGVFLLADDFFANVGRIPETPDGGTRPWIGIAGMQPVDREVAGYLGLRDRGAVVISTILAGSPAEEGGLLDKDIVVGIDGKKLPKLRPDEIAQRYLERAVLKKNPGDLMRLTVIRGEEEKNLQIKVGIHPKPINLASRKYLQGLGFTVREFVVSDAILRRVPNQDSTGVIASFVKPNSPVNTAGLHRGDWIKEIDGRRIENYEDAVVLLTSIEEDKKRDDFVMLIDRANETSVLRVKLQ